MKKKLNKKQIVIKTNKIYACKTSFYEFVKPYTDKHKIKISQI